MKYIFYDQAKSSPSFDVEIEAGKPFPVDKVVGLLAMHCFVKNKKPTDFKALIDCNEPWIAECQLKAESLLKVGLELRSNNVRLTPRERQVLKGIVNCLSNKEIARELNLSERTIKFHVSSLLVKFKVSGRMNLIHTFEEKNDELELDSLGRDKHQLPIAVKDIRRRAIRRIVSTGVGPHAVAV